jgi:hypothetical protein
MHADVAAALALKLPPGHTHATYAEHALSNDASCEAQLVGRHATHPGSPPPFARHETYEAPPSPPASATPNVAELHSLEHPEQLMSTCWRHAVQSDVACGAQLL